MTARRIELPKPVVDPESLGYFRYGEIGDRRIITNDAGEYHVLDRAGFDAFLAGEIGEDHAEYEKLQQKGLLRSKFDVDTLADKVRRKKAFLGQGPHLHIVITTLRCNQSCAYCHASRTDMDTVGTDMSIETAKQAVDMAMQSTSPSIIFEYTGGEPTVNMEALRFCVEYSREKNKYENKHLEHSVVTNMTYMTEENAQFLIDNNVFVCTSLDGPEALHNWNRFWRKGTNAYADVIRWIKYFNQKYVDAGRDPDLWHVDSLMTTTRKTFDHWKELVDLYVELGIKNIHIRPLNPFGFASKTWERIGYTTDEYLEFYERTLDYIIELNKQGIEIMEGTASTFLMKMLTPDDPNFVDLRSPLGSGIGQLAYSYDGKIYPSDEGRMVAGMGSDFFLLGELGKSTYQQVVNHPTVKTLAMSSIVDTLPQCSTCWNAPYCGVRPIHNWMNGGDLFGQRPLTPKCKEHMSIAKMLFERMIDDETGRIEAIFRRWTVRRARLDETGNSRTVG